MKITGRCVEIHHIATYVNEQCVIYEYWIAENEHDFTAIPYERGTVIVFLFDPGDSENTPGMKYAVLSGTIRSAAVKGNITRKYEIFCEPMGNARPPGNINVQITLEGINIHALHTPENVAHVIVMERQKKWRKYLEAQDSLIE